MNELHGGGQLHKSFLPNTTTWTSAHIFVQNKPPEKVSI